jgi:hypothetical protein
MKKLLFAFILGFVVLTFFSCVKEQPWRPLFNGENLDNWDKFIGTPLKGFDSLAQAATVEKVFSVVETNGAKLIRISGEVNASLATKESFDNYHLRLVFKWGDKVYTSRNSGLLYKSTGDFGAAFGTWMTTIECQLMHGNLGDTYLMSNTVCETQVIKNDSTRNYNYSQGAEALPFGEKTNGRSIKKLTDAEKSLGDWNTVDLYCFGQKSVHVINGITVMMNDKSGLEKEGVITPLISGKIQLQSEGGELFIKSIDIQPINKLPEEF